MSKANMFNKKINLLVCMIFLFAILPLVSSVSPFISTNAQGGCTIVPIIRDTIKQSTDFDFNFHVINQSNGYPISNASISCYFHLYNQTGDHVLFQELRNDPISEHLVINEFVARVGGGNFSSVGNYAYQVQCNGTMVIGGCADKGLFVVTPNGIEATTGRAFVDIGLLFVLLVFLTGAVLIFMSSENLLARVGMFGFGYLLLIAVTFISWNMATDFLLSAPFIADMFRILFFVLIIGAFPLLLGAFAWYVIMLFRIKEIERLMGKGMSYDEAERRQGRKYK
jgi:hypothetical protein